MAAYANVRLLLITYRMKSINAGYSRGFILTLECMLQQLNALKCRWLLT